MVLCDSNTTLPVLSSAMLLAMDTGSELKTLFLTVVLNVITLYNPRCLPYAGGKKNVSSD